jgi:hypothetical protein
MKKVKIIVKKPMGWNRIWQFAEITCDRKDMNEIVKDLIDIKSDFPRNPIIEIEEV